MEFQGRTALVTGASRGIGRAIATSFAKRGADVIIHYRSDEEAANHTLSEVQSRGVRGRLSCADLSTLDGIETLVHEVVHSLKSSHHHRLDFLINNAGVLIRTDYLDQTSDEYDLCMDLNVRTPYFLTQKLAAHLEGGCVVNIGSVAGIKNRRKRGIVYGMSKVALHYLTGSQARALAPNTRVNCVAPGYVLTDMFGNKPERIAEAKAETPSGEISTVEDVANAVLYLCGESARNITGQILVVDGGISRT